MNAPQLITPAFAHLLDADRAKLAADYANIDRRLDAWSDRIDAVVADWDAYCASFGIDHQTVEAHRG